MNMNSHELMKVVENVNEQILLVKNYLKENGLDKAYDLKLHDVSWYCSIFNDNGFKKDFPNLTKKDMDNYFLDFCEIEFFLLTTEITSLFGNGWDDCVRYIGHSSSFHYAAPAEIDNIEGFICDKYSCSSVCCDNILYWDIFSSDGDSISYKKLLDSIQSYTAQYENEEEGIRDVIADLYHIQKNLLRDIKTQCADILTIKNYVDNFKKEQVERFIDFIENNY